MTPEAIQSAKEVMQMVMTIAVTGQMFCALFDGNKWAKLILILLMELIIFVPYYMAFVRLLR